jgi:hypothetical protein
VKHNHKVIVAFLAGWLVAAFLPPTTVLSGLKGKASGS